MNYGIDTFSETSSPEGRTAAATWDRLWRYHPTAARDEALLARERRGPRWMSIVDRLEGTFGSIRNLQTVELGSGRGDLSVLLAQRGARVTLIDSSAEVLRQARHRFDRLGLSAQYEHGDSLSTGESWSDRFDVSLSSGVVEHFRGDDRTRVVRAHFEALRPGGMGIISVPNAWCLPYRLWKSYLELRGWWPYGTELPYTRRELIRRSRDAGFDSVEGRCMGFWQSVGDQLATAPALGARTSASPTEETSIVAELG